jgi:hypothetical protein
VISVTDASVERVFNLIANASGGGSLQCPPRLAMCESLRVLREGGIRS